jgi:hypothetical protein
MEKENKIKKYAAKETAKELAREQREKIIDSVIDSFKDEEAADYFYEAEIIQPVPELTTSEEKEVVKVVKITDDKEIKRVYVVISVFLIVFALIGVISTIEFTSGRVAELRNRTALKEEFAAFVYPVVINDPPSFDSVDNLQSSTIINSAVWKIILTGDKSNYSTDMGVFYIPAADVELAARSIFGTGGLEHRSVSSRGIQFIYSSQNNNYEVPENPPLFSYSPLITNVENVGELYTVTIDYMMPSPLAIAGIEHDNEPIKTMVYTISRTRERMTINSIQSGQFIVR